MKEWVATSETRGVSRGKTLTLMGSHDSRPTPERDKVLIQTTSDEDRKRRRPRVSCLSDMAKRRRFYAERRQAVVSDPPDLCAPHLILAPPPSPSPVLDARSPAPDAPRASRRPVSIAPTQRRRCLFARLSSALISAESAVMASLSRCQLAADSLRVAPCGPAIIMINRRVLRGRHLRRACV